MSQPRRLTDTQRAAHLLIPIVGSVIKELQQELDAIGMETRRKRRSQDLTADWVEFESLASGRLQGAQRIVAVLEAMARG